MFKTCSSSPERLNTETNFFSLDRQTKQIKRLADLKDLDKKIIVFEKSLLSTSAVADRCFYSLENKNHGEQLVYALVKHQPINDAYTFSFLEEGNQPTNQPTNQERL